MTADRHDSRQFSDDFDDAFPVGPQEGNCAYFGRNVLRGLVEGIDEFIDARQERWHPFRSMGPVLLGSAMWIDDAELIARLGKLSAAAIVVTKQGRGVNTLRKLEQLELVNEHAPGLPMKAFPYLGDLATKVDGKPAVVGPYDRMGEDVIPTIRTLGYRRRQGRLVPIMHAKLALLGSMFWYDEGPAGQMGDFAGFRPRRLWVASANFTASSRRSLEWGYWTEQPELLEGAERFLLRAIRASEPLNSEADSPDPEYAPVQFDDAAMAEAVGEMRWNESDIDMYDE